MTSPLPVATLAYVAGIIDADANLGLRRFQTALLPRIEVNRVRTQAVMPHLARLTGTSLSTIARDYNRAPCAEHCEAQHQHVVSQQYRWHLSGARATAVLLSVRPYLLVQGDRADELLAVGLAAGFKGATYADMARRGWTVPEPRLQLAGAAS